MKRWKDEHSNSFSSGRGFGEITNFGSPSPMSAEDRCSTRRIVESTCKTEEVEPGKFIRKCEKTEKILRDCVGRPVEVVLSKTEHTEDDVTDEVTGGSLPLVSPGGEPFTFPGFRGGLDAIDRGLRGDLEGIERGLTEFLDAAEEMANSFFKSFGGFPSQHGRGGEASPFGQERPAARQFEKDASSKQTNDDSICSENLGEIRDV